MGSGTKRKKKDQPLIRTPKVVISNTESNETVGKVLTKGLAEQAAEMCPVSFQKSISNKSIGVVGASLELILHDKRYSYFLAGIELGALSMKESNTVTNCGELGIKYSGQIVDINGNYYARFIRVA